MEVPCSIRMKPASHIPISSGGGQFGLVMPPVVPDDDPSAVALDEVSPPTLVVVPSVVGVAVVSASALCVVAEVAVVVSELASSGTTHTWSTHCSPARHVSSTHGPFSCPGPGPASPDPPHVARTRSRTAQRRSARGGSIIKIRICSFRILVKRHRHSYRTQARARADRQLAGDTQGKPGPADFRAGGVSLLDRLAGCPPPRIVREPVRGKRARATITSPPELRVPRRRRPHRGARRYEGPLVARFRSDSPAAVRAST